MLRKRKLFELIKLRVLADREGYEFKFTLDGKIVSTNDDNSLSSFEDQLEEYEERHPEVSVRDMADRKKLLQEDTPFAKKLNNMKRNLATIEQTWGSLFRCRYSYSEEYGYAFSRV